MTTRTPPRRSTPVPAAIGGGVGVGLALLVTLGLAVVLGLIVKWLLVTTALLVVPFGIWWALDRSHRRRDAPMPVTAVIPRPRRAPDDAAAPLVPVARVAPAIPVTPAAPPRYLPRAVSSPSPAPSRPFLAPDRRVTVTREEDHQPALARHHRDRPVTRVTAELHAAVVARGTHRGAPAVEVRLDGERVGELTAAMSARYRHLVEPTVGPPAACLATIAHGERGYQIELRLPKV